MRASRMFAAVTAALIAAVLSLGGASLVVAGQPQAGGTHGQGNGNGWANGNANGHADVAPQQSTPVQAAPAPAPAVNGSQKSSAGSGGHQSARAQERHAVKQQRAQAPAHVQAPAPVLSQGGGSHSTATSGPGNSSQGCDGSHNSNTGHGANHSGPYDNTCNGSPSGNGNGGGKATGKPCAGCVGNADDKNPKGQYPNGSDHNAGYECDRNHGIGRTNPAHTGCNSAETPTPPPSGGCTREMRKDQGECGGKTEGEHPGNPGCPSSTQLGSALTQAVAVALQAMATMHPELAKASEIATKASAGCGKSHGNHTSPGHGKGKVTICHATGSATNPYVEITISVNGLHGHAHHQDGRDIIPAPAGGCAPGSSSTPPGGEEKPPAESTLPPTQSTPPPAEGTPPPTAITAPPTEIPGQQAVLGARAGGSSGSAQTTTPGSTGSNAVLGQSGSSPTAAAAAPAAAQAARPAESGGGSLPFTGTDALQVLLLGCVMLLGGIALSRVMGRRTS